MVKYVVVQDLVFLLVWMLALATTMSGFLYPDSRRYGEVIFALCDIPTLTF